MRTDITDNNRERILLTRMVFGFILLSLLFRYINHSLLSDMQAPVLKYPLIDYTYWLIHLTGLPDIVTGNSYLSFLFDSCLITSALIVFCFPLKRFFTILFTLLYFFYFICYNSYAMHHSHPMAGIFFLSIAFWPKKEATFKIIWEGIRYIVIFIYVDAFVFKLLNGAVFNPTQGMANVKENIGWIMLGSDSFIFNKDFYAFFLRHNMLMQAGYLMIVFLEGIIVVGFFTKKIDRYLFWCPIIIHTVNYIFVDVCFAEMMIVSIVFLNTSKIPYLVQNLFYYQPNHFLQKFYLKK